MIDGIYVYVRDIYKQIERQNDSRFALLKVTLSLVIHIDICHWAQIRSGADFT